MKIYVVNLVNRKKAYALAAALTVTVIVLAMLTKALAVGIGEILMANAGELPYENIIILDPGHGGEDPGAIGVNGVYEKDINLHIALEMGKMLEEKGYIVIYTRTDDRLLYAEDENIKGIRKISDLKNRCKVADRYPESLFISIHMNSFGSSKYSGTQVYYKPDSNTSIALADNIQSKVKADLQQNNKRDIKEGKSIYVLENIANTAILIECGFLTNEAECKKLSEKEYQKQLSFSIVCGIIEYMNTLES